MGKVTGFLEIEREQPARRKVEERLQDWFEIYEPFPEEKQRKQGARCMDCGVPFCHTGCPVNNLIPDWNDLVYNGRWEAAIRRLHATNNFPEFTGRICPAPCEAACVLDITEPAVSIKLIERSVVERAWDEGWIHPEPPEQNTGKRVAVVGSGPAGLAAAQQLRRAGHSVTVYEKADRIGGLLRYGIPNFKLEKHIIERRIQQMRDEGVTFVTNAHVGVNMPVKKLTENFDAILLCGGAEQPRDLKIPGRELKGIHFAMEFLPQQNRRCEGDTVDPSIAILAEGKRVVIIGGGDTGADCLGTSLRQHAMSVHQFEIMPKPPEQRAASTPWPMWPMQLRTETSHEEGGIRDWSINSVQIHRRRRRPRPTVARGARRPSAEVRTYSRLRVQPRRRSGAAGDGLSWACALGHDRATRRGSGQPRKRCHRRRIPDFNREYLCRRRHAPRPIAGGLGHQRRPQGGRGRRSLPGHHC